MTAKKPSSNLKWADISNSLTFLLAPKFVIVSKRVRLSRTLRLIIPSKAYVPGWANFFFLYGSTDSCGIIILSIITAGQETVDSWWIGRSIKSHRRWMSAIIRRLVDCYSIVWSILINFWPRQFQNRNIRTELALVNAFRICLGYCHCFPSDLRETCYRHRTKWGMAFPLPVDIPILDSRLP